MKLFDLSTESIENRIRNLAKKYVPEWQFDYDRNTKNADIGGAIARIFALQMMENVDMLNRMPERYHAEFVNMLDISLLLPKQSSNCYSSAVLGKRHDKEGSPE